MSGAVDTCCMMRGRGPTSASRRDDGSLETACAKLNPNDASASSGGGVLGTADRDGDSSTCDHAIGGRAGGVLGAWSGSLRAAGDRERAGTTAGWSTRFLCGVSGVRIDIVNDGFTQVAPLK